MEVDRVFAGDDVGNGAAAGLAGGLLALCVGCHLEGGELLVRNSVV